VRIPAAPALWLQELHRRYKLAILLIAAWAPVSFPQQLFMAAGILVIATALFLIATRSAPQPAVTESGRVPPIDPQS
jgi:hypothetical protein